MLAEYLNIERHGIWEEKEDPEHHHYKLSDEESQNVIDTLYDVKFDIDPEDGQVKSVYLSNGQVFSTKIARLNVIVAAHKVMEDMTSEDRLDYIRSFGVCLHCGEEINGTCYCHNDD